MTCHPVNASYYSGIRAAAVAIEDAHRMQGDGLGDAIG